MSLLTVVQSNFLQTDSAVVNSLSADTIVATVADAAITVANTTSVSDIASTTTLQATQGILSSVNATTVNSTALLPTSASFTNPPTCAVQPTTDDQLANKAYVDAAMGGGGGGGGVETVSGTGAISATVTTTLLSGTQHALPVSATKGAEKVIVNMNNNALSRVLTQAIFLNNTGNQSNTRISVLQYDSVLNRMYVGGNFQEVGGIEGTAGVAYYDFTNNSWNSLAGGLFSSAFSFNVNAIRILGNNVYVGGDFLNALDVSLQAVANTKNVAYFNTSNNQWNSVAPAAVFNQAVINLRSFQAGQMYIMGSFVDKIIVFNEGVGYSTFSVNNSTSNVRDCLVANNRLFVCGDFTSFVTVGGTIANTRYLAYYDFNDSTWKGYDANSQFNNRVYQLQPYNSQVLMLGAFTSVGSAANNYYSTPLNVCAVLNTAPTPPSFTQFPYPFFYSQNETNKLYVTSDNTLWISHTDTENQVLNQVVNGNSPNLNKQVFFGGIAKYDAVNQIWEPVVNVAGFAFADTNTPGVKWIGTTSIPPINGIINAHGGLLKLDESQLQTVTSSFNENSVPRSKFLLTYKHQTVKLVNADNSAWSLKSVSSGTVSNTGTQLQVSALIPFF